MSNAQNKTFPHSKRQSTTSQTEQKDTNLSSTTTTRTRIRSYSDVSRLSKGYKTNNGNKTYLSVNKLMQKGAEFGTLERPLFRLHLTHENEMK